MNEDKETQTLAEEPVAISSSLDLHAVRQLSESEVLELANEAAFLKAIGLRVSVHIHRTGRRES